MAEIEFFPDPEDWPTYTFSYPYEDVVAYGPDGLAKALEWLGPHGYNVAVGTDDGFGRSNRVGVLERVRRAMRLRGLDPERYRCLR